MSRLAFNRSIFNMKVLRFVAALGTFAFVAWISVETFSDFSLDSVELFPLAFSAVFYVASVAALPFFWVVLLKAYAPAWNSLNSSDYQRLIVVYSRSWIARYVPGRVWMFGGRVLYGSAIGIPKWTVLKTTIIEGLMLAAIMLWLSTVILLVSVGQWPGAAGLAVIVPALFALYLKNPQKVIAVVPTRRLRELLAPPDTRAISLACVYGLVINALLLGSMTLLAESMLNVDAATAWKVSSLWGISVVAGYLTVVTPAGLGVREAVGVLLLGTVMDRADAALFMAMSRGIALAVDLGLALVAEAYAHSARAKVRLTNVGGDDAPTAIGSANR